MKHLFVPYELAVKLKEKGFNEKCLRLWITQELNAPTLRVDGKINSQTVREDSATAPTYQQVFDWFRYSHQLHIEFCIGHDDSSIWYNGYIKKIQLGYEYGSLVNDIAFSKYEDCQEETINQALKLI